MAAALAAQGAASAQEGGLPGIQLADVAGGDGGFYARGEGEPASQAGASVAAAGDVNGDGLPDLVMASGLAEAHYPRLSGAAYVVFGPAAPRPPRFRRSAVNQDGQLNLTDGVRVLRSLFAGGAASPRPRRAPGASQGAARTFAVPADPADPGPTRSPPQPS